VDAESLYEAVAIAVGQFREDDMNPPYPGPMTEIRGRCLQESPWNTRSSWGKWRSGKSKHQGRAGGDYEAAESAGAFREYLTLLHTCMRAWI
jgi:hypothetical protein